MPTTQRQSFARRVGASYSTMNQHAFGRPISIEAHLAIERESGGIVPIPIALSQELASAGYLKSCERCPDKQGGGISMDLPVDHQEAA